MSKKSKMLKFIGIVCWFLALFLLLDERQAQKAQEAEEAKQNAIVQQMEDKNAAGEEVESTLIFPSED